MKKIFAIMAAVVCLWGCEKNEIFTPMTVTLASEGQTMTVETTIQPQTLDILDYDGNGMNMPEYDAETGTYTCSYLWLTASIFSLFSTKLTSQVELFATLLAKLHHTTINHQCVYHPAYPQENRIALIKSSFLCHQSII